MLVRFTLIMSMPAALDIVWVKIQFPAIVRDKWSGKLINCDFPRRG